MPGSLLIKGGRVVNDDSMFDADVVVENGIITHVGKELTAPAGARTIDAHGKLVMPGGIDPHTHLQLPVMGTVTVDDFLIGTQAALAGGTTMIIDFVVPDGKESLVTAFDRWKGWADPKVCCDYGLSVAITQWDDKTASEMAVLTREKGINSFKFYMAYKNMIMIRDDDMYQAFLECRKLGAVARVHAENGDVIWEKQHELLQLGITGPEGHTQSRPEELEAEATNRACVLAGQANCPLYVVHVTTKGAAERIAAHRLKGAIIIGEAIAAALAIDGHNLYHTCWQHAAAHVSSPPLSHDPTTPSYLMDLLACGQLQVTGSDNCTYSAEQKAIGKGDFTKIPNGVNGLEDRMSVIWEKGVHSGKLDPMRFVAITSTAAAKIFNIYPKKGRIAVGSDADIVIWDPTVTRTISVKTHHQAVDFNVFEGLEVHGVPVITITRGVVAWENGKLSAVKGSGKFVPLPANSPAVFGAIEQRGIMLAPRKVERDDD